MIIYDLCQQCSDQECRRVTVINTMNGSWVLVYQSQQGTLIWGKLLNCECTQLGVRRLGYAISGGLVPLLVLAPTLVYITVRRLRSGVCYIRGSCPYWCQLLPWCVSLIVYRLLPGVCYVRGCINVYWLLPGYVISVVISLRDGSCLGYEMSVYMSLDVGSGLGNIATVGLRFVRKSECYLHYRCENEYCSGSAIAWLGEGI